MVSGFLLVKVCALAACSPCTWKCVPLVDLLNSLLWAGRNGLLPTLDNLHLGCSYHLHSSHRFLSTWGAVMLEKSFSENLSSSNLDNKLPKVSSWEQLMILHPNSTVQPETTFTLSHKRAICDEPRARVH